MNDQMMHQLVQMFIMAHLSGMVKGHQMATGGGSKQAGSQRPKGGSGSAGAPAARQPKNQGARGRGQGARGATGPMKAGVPGMQNRLGQLPHQQPFAPQNNQNPIMMLMQAAGMGQ